jgi:hypothetical protein
MTLPLFSTCILSSRLSAARRLVTLGLISTVIVLAGCGGAGDPETKTGGGGTGIAPPPEPVAASGPVNSLGPMGVAGTSLDTTNVNVLLNASGMRSSNDLRLGMVVDAAGEIQTDTNMGKAQAVVAQSTVRGPVQAIDIAAQRVASVGVIADVDQNTILENFTSLAALNRGDRIEIYGLPQETTGRVLATRIILYRNASATEPVEVLGTTSSVTPSTLQIAGASVATSQAQVVLVNGLSLGVPLPANTVVGTGTRVRVIGNLDGQGNVLATQIVAGLAPQRAVNSIVALEGTVLLSTPTLVKISDEKVDLSGLPELTAARVAPGARAQVRGRKLDTQVRATDARVVDGTDRFVYQVEGTVTEFVSSASFKVAGETISALTARFSNGSTADLNTGRRVRIKAVAGPGVLDATEVTLLP